MYSCCFCYTYIFEFIELLVTGLSLPTISEIEVVIPLLLIFYKSELMFESLSEYLIIEN